VSLEKLTVAQIHEIPAVEMRCQNVFWFPGLYFRQLILSLPINKLGTNAADMHSGKSQSSHQKLWMRFLKIFSVPSGTCLVSRLPLLDLDSFLPNYFQFIGNYTIRLTLCRLLRPSQNKPCLKETHKQSNSNIGIQQPWGLSGRCSVPRRSVWTSVFIVTPNSGQRHTKTAMQWACWVNTAAI
jgi:hypothetical protein